MSLIPLQGISDSSTKCSRIGLVLVIFHLLALGLGTANADRPNQPNQSQEKNPTFTLDVETSASNGSVNLTPPSGGEISLNLIYTGPTLKNVPISLSPFTSDSGSKALDVSLGSTCKEARSGTGSQSISVDADPSKLIPLCFVIGNFPTNKTYTGLLRITPTSAPFVIKTITFKPPMLPQGVLMVDQNALSRTFTRAFCAKCLWWRPGHTDELSVGLREKTSAIELEGVSVRLESSGGASENSLDLGKNLTFLWNDKETDLERYPPKDPSESRIIGLGDHPTIKIRLHGLKPGDYTAVLRFSAINSSADDAQKLELHTHIRSSIVWAIFWLLLAVGVSFTGTKVLTTMRYRATLLSQIRALEPQWFSSAQPTPLVVGLRALLHQTKSLSRRFWLTSPDQIAATLDNARRMLHVLDVFRQMRDKLQVALKKFVYRRVVIGLDRIASRLGDSPLSDTDVQTILTELAQFNDWLDPQKFPTVFWADIQPAFQSLQSDMTVTPDPRFQDPDVLAWAGAVSQALTTPPTDRVVLEHLYEQYVRLKVLWDERDAFADLIGPAKGDLSQFLEIADAREWNRIKADALELRTPKPSSPDDLEAFEVLHFSVKAINSKLEQTYIFRHKIEYQWEFELEPTNKKTPKVLLQPVSLGPSIVQYFPQAGKVSAKVTLKYGADTKPIQASDPLSISPSSDFQPYKILAGAEILSWMISAVTAVVTGLSMYYFKGTSWGTYQDYLTLVLWGMGVDQGKTFVQALQANSPPSIASTSH